MKILVTGGAGFIGSNLCETIAAEHDVTVYDNLSLGSRDNLKAVKDSLKIVRGDILDRKIRSMKCDTIVHLAGASSAPMFMPDPSKGLNTNINGFVNVLECAKANGAVLIYASTSSIYGNNPVPLREDQMVTPPNFYSVSKLTMENLAYIYNVNYGVSSAGLRFMSVYGPHERSKGKFANLVSQFMWWMLEGKSPVIYGDGNQKRDFTYVKDIVQAIMLLLEAKGSEIYNVGTNKAYSLNQLVGVLNKVMGTDIRPEYIENPMKNYIMTQLADITKMGKLGYKPRYTLENGIRECFDYYRVRR